MKKILLGSPVRQTPRVLHHFLKSVAELSRGDFELDYAFVDDNTDEEASVMLHRVPAEIDGDVWIRKVDASDGKYSREGATHNWDPTSVWKVAAFKDELIERARAGSYDGLFLVDSDLVLHRETLVKLDADAADIVSMVFWTSWTPGQQPLPQVWESDQYNMDEQFVAKLRVPDVYKVGGLGACTLISRRAIEKGVSFAQIDNLTFAGEDRHFCVRARALGIELHADTTLPPTHLYRDSDVDKLEGIDTTADAMQSRFVLKSDERADTVTLPLPRHWWSRPYEYAWAQKLVEPTHDVLEVACGISEPLKLWLARHAESVAVLDKDERILSKESILADICDDFGEKAAVLVDADGLLPKIEASQGAPTKLPYSDGEFERVFCISALGRLPAKDLLLALSEIRRVLTPSGIAALTFESPPLSVERLEATMQLVGLKFAGPVDRDATPDALVNTGYGRETRVFRAVVTPDPVAQATSSAGADLSLAFMLPLCKWDPARVASQQRLKEQLAPFPDWVNAKILASHQLVHMSVWFKGAVEWFLTQPQTHAMLLQDDTRVAPDFWVHLYRMLQAKPNHVIAFHTIHPDARVMQAAHLKWTTMMDVIPGVAWVFPMPLLRKMRQWQDTMLRHDWESRLTEDTLLGLFCAVHNIPIWHPLPTIVDHRISDKEIKSTYGHDSLDNRNAALTWEQASLPEDWHGKSVWCGRGFQDTPFNLARNVRVWSDDLMAHIEKGSPPAERGAPDPEILAVMTDAPTTSSRS